MAKMVISVGKGKDSVGVTAAKSAMRERVYSVIVAALAAEFGAESAGMVRVESETTGKGESLAGAVVADISEGGGVFDGAVTVKVTVKDWTERVGTKTVKPAWDYEGARELYDKWVVDETAKKEAAAAQKKAKAEADAAARAKRKAEADAKKKAKTAPAPDEEGD